MARKSNEMQPQETVRFSEDELTKMKELHARALHNNKGYAPKQHILKELIGLWTYNLITAEDRSSLADDRKLQVAGESKRAKMKSGP